VKIEIFSVYLFLNILNIPALLEQ